jgi:hypothetical protein
MPKKATVGKPAARRASATAAANAKGCCTIQYDNKPEDQISGITQAECRLIAGQRGGTAQWTPGACAEA